MKNFILGVISGFVFFIAIPVVAMIIYEAQFDKDIVPCTSGEHCYNTPEKCATINGRIDPETGMCDLHWYDWNAEKCAKINGHIDPNNKRCTDNMFN